jgi:hypothetical protein
LLLLLKSLLMLHVFFLATGFQHMMKIRVYTTSFRRFNQSKMLENSIVEANHKFKQQRLDGTQGHLTQGDVIAHTSLPFGGWGDNKELVDFVQELIGIEKMCAEVFLDGFGKLP